MVPNPPSFNAGHDPATMCKSFIEELQQQLQSTSGKISIETHRQFLSETITKFTLLGSALAFQSTIKQSMAESIDKLDTKMTVLFQQTTKEPVSYRDTLLTNIPPTKSKKISSSFDYGKIKITHPSGSNPEALKRSLQTKCLQKLPQVRILRVFTINDSSSTVHFYPCSALDDLSHHFNTICAPLHLKLQLKPKQIIIHNIPVQPSTFELISEDLSAQNIQINSVRWLSKKKVEQLKKTHSSVVIDVTSAAQYQELKEKSAIILLNDFRKIEQFNYQHRQTKPKDPQRTTSAVDPLA